MYCDNAWSLLQKHVYSDNTSLEVTKPAPKNVYSDIIGITFDLYGSEVPCKKLQEALSEVWEIGLGSK